MGKMSFTVPQLCKFTHPIRSGFEYSRIHTESYKDFLEVELKRKSIYGFFKASDGLNGSGSKEMNLFAYSSEFLYGVKHNSS